MAFPTSDAVMPSTKNVTAAPAAKIIESIRDFFVSYFLSPAEIYPVISGILESAHGVSEVNIPATNEADPHVVFYQIYNALRKHFKDIFVFHNNKYGALDAAV